MHLTTESSTFLQNIKVSNPNSKFNLLIQFSEIKHILLVEG